MLHLVKTFMIYQIINSFPSKWKPLPTKFRKRFLYFRKDNNVSSVIFGVYVNLKCVNVASNNFMYSILIIREISRSH